MQLFRKNRIAAAVSIVAVLGAAAVAMAQDAAPKAGTDAAASPRVAAARELLELSGSTQRFEMVVPTMLSQMTATMSRLRPDKKAEIEQAVGAMSTKMLQRKDELIGQLAAFYAETIAPEDIAGLIAFYKSPLGQRFVAKQPALTQGSMAIGQRWGATIGAEVERGLREELKKRGVDL